jgi:hypothetical protein
LNNAINHSAAGASGEPMNAKKANKSDHDCSGRQAKDDESVFAHRQVAFRHGATSNSVPQ